MNKNHTANNKPISILHNKWIMCPLQLTSRCGQTFVQGVPITGVSVANPYNVGQDCHMESTFEHNPPLLKQSTPKRDSPLRREGGLFDSIELPLTIEEVAERLGISEEAACAIVVSSLQVSQVSLKSPLPRQFPKRRLTGSSVHKGATPPAT